jgi:nitric oxide dioxygenase
MLSQHQIDLIKSTVPVLRENGVALTDYFYNRMLTNNPQLKETFNMGHQRSGAQAKALAGAVLAYAENIEDPSVLAPVVELICHKHVSLNIQHLSMTLSVKTCCTRLVKYSVFQWITN